MKRIEFGNIIVNSRMRELVNQTLDSNWLTMGPRVEEFEKKFAEKMSYSFASMVNCGTSADIASLIAVQEGDPRNEIILPALSFIAVANSVKAANLKPVYVDIRCETLNINEDLIEEKITSNCLAILAVQTMGRPLELDKLRNLCDKYNLALILDECESYGCKYKGKPTSEWADISTTSFFSAHLCFGVEGAAVCTNDKDTNDLIRSIRSHGRSPDSAYFNHLRYGLNFKPTDLHACIALASLEQFDDTWAKRKAIQYELYNLDFLREVCWLSEEDPQNENCPHGFSLTTKNTQNFPLLTATLDKYNIHWKRNFGAVTQHRAFNVKESFPEAEYVGNYGLHIGISQNWTDEELGRIKTAFKEFYNECV